MSSSKLYSKKMLNIFRIIAAVCFCVLLIAEIAKFFIPPVISDFLSVSTHVINCVNLVIFALLFFNPYKFGLMAVVSFSYAVLILTQENLYDNPMGLMMYVLTFAFLMARGFFRTRRKFKIISAVVLFFALFLTELRFGVVEFLSRCFVGFLGYSLVLALIIFFISQYLLQGKKSDSELILDLSQFPDLTERDKEWLRMVQQKTKYEVIAKQYNMSLGTVRNRFHQIYKIIEVSDRIGFMATYAGYVLKD